MHKPEEKCLGAWALRGSIRGFEDQVVYQLLGQVNHDGRMAL